MPAARRAGHGMRERAMGVASAGLRAGKNAYRFGRQSWKAGKRAAAFIAAERERRGKTHSEVMEEGTLRQTSAEEQLGEMREKHLEKILERDFPEEVVEELGTLMEEAESQGAGASELHLALAKFFEERYPSRDPVNVLRIKKWIRIILRSRGEESAQYVNKEPSLSVEK